MKINGNNNDNDNLTKINLPKNGNSDHVFNELHKYTHALTSNNIITSMSLMA